MFELNGVSYSYRGDGQLALSNVTLRLRPGATTAVLGLSGSGKSTLLNLMGLLSDGVGHQGGIVYGGQPFNGQSASQTAQLRRDEFGFILQSAYMLPHFTCGDNVGMPLALQKVDPPEIDRRVTEILEFADPSGNMLALKNRLAREVSGGERQRMAVLRAVIHDPRVLFADEPLSSLDPKNAERILQLLERWKSGELHKSKRNDRSLVLVTHDIQVAWDQAEDFAILCNGKLIEERIWSKEELAELGGPEHIRRLIMAGGEKTLPTAAAAPKFPPKRSFLRFLAWFAWKNLWERNARRSTWINLLSLAVVVAFVIVTFGLTYGVDEARLNQLRKDPLNLCLWIGSSVVETPIDEKFTQDLEAKISAAIDEGMLDGVHAFSETNFVWFKKDGKTRRVTGRTIAPDDPMLKSVALKSGKRDGLSEGDAGIVVSPGMLLGLDYEADELPDKLSMEPPAGGRVEVPILGIAEKALPLGHDFVISEGYEARLRYQNPNPTIGSDGTRGIAVGPLPDDWPAVSELPESVRGMFVALDLSLPSEVLDKDNRRMWKLDHNGNGQIPRLSDVKLYVRRINDQMVREGFSSRPGLAELDAPEDKGLVLPVRDKHDYAGIYFTDIAALEPAAVICRAEKLPVNEDVVSQLTAIGGQTKAVLAILTFIAFAIGGVVAFYMALVQVLRNEQKVAEIGMLKAIGMTPAALGVLALVESGILWSLGTLLGIALALGGGPLMALGNFSDANDGLDAGFYFSWKVATTAAIASLVICLASNYFATWKSRHQPASKSLGSA